MFYILGKLTKNKNKKKRYLLCLKETDDQKADLLNAWRKHKMNQRPLLFIYQPKKHAV